MGQPVMNGRVVRAQKSSHHRSTWLLLSRFTLRHWRLAPRQSLLLVFILAMGIAVYFSIRLANRAALASFENFTDIVTSQSDWVITAPAGTLPAAVLSELGADLEDIPVQIIPVVETTATRPREGNEEAIGSRRTFQLLGLDLVGVQNLRGDRKGDRSWFDQGSGGDGAPPPNRFWEVLRQDRAVFVSEHWAQSEGVGRGDPFPVVIHDRIVELRVAGIIPETEGGPEAPAHLLVMDLPALQGWAGKVGELDRIEFVVETGPGMEERRVRLGERLREVGRDRWLVSTPTDRMASAVAMTRAFRLNLTMLSLVALLVGLYLIFQSLDGAVVRRREEIGILRSLGVEEGTIRKVWLWEAALLGLGGGLVGLGLGWGGAQISVRLVGRTVNALYYATSVDAAYPSWFEAGAALVLAVGASLVAGWWPAREAARTPPAQILVRHAVSPPGSWWWRREWLGGVL